MTDFNPLSDHDVSKLLFGGIKKYSIKVELTDEVGNVVRLKSGEHKGEIKYKNITLTKELKGLVEPVQEWETKIKGIYQTNESVLDEILCKEEDKDIIGICTLLLEIRSLDKELNTYYNGIINKYLYKDNYIHASYNHTETATGRLSSRKPNNQNIPGSKDSKTRQHYISRYKNGKIIVADFSQLEVVIFAHECQDQQLIKDLNSGVDIHRKIASKIYNKPEEEITTDERKLAKATSFHLIYGGSDKGLMKRLKITLLQARKMIGAFYKTYPQAKEWQELMMLLVDYNDKNKGEGFYTTFTGKKYIFKKLKYGFYAPDIKNYRIQGTAYDLVALAIGTFFRERAIHKRDKYLMVNTVHDNLEIDCREEYIDECVQDLHEVLDNITPLVYNRFKVDIKVPIKIDVKMGNNLWECD